MYGVVVFFSQGSENVLESKFLSKQYSEYATRDILNRTSESYVQWYDVQNNYSTGEHMNSS